MDDNSEKLRNQAKEELRQGKIIDTSLYETDMKILVEELSIYQIELEHQNQELMLSQELLQQSNDRYLDLFDKAPIGYLIVDSTGIIKDINQTACKLLECSKTEFIDTKISKIIHPDYQDIYYLYFRTLIHQKHQQPCDIKLRKANNTTFFARIQGVCQAHEIDHEAEFRLAISDISSQKEMEMKLLAAKAKTEKNEKAGQNLLGDLKTEMKLRAKNELALRESEERFQLLFNKAPLGYQSLDINGCFIDVNQQWLDTLGYERDEIIGKWFGDFLTPMYQEGFRKRFPIFKAQGHIHSEFEMVHKNGSILFIAFDGRIGNDSEGNFKQTHCILQDVTEIRLKENALRQSEEMMRSSQSVAHICSYSTNLIVDAIANSAWTCSPEFYEIFGIDKSYPHTIEGWAGFVHPDFREEMVAYHEYVIKEKIRFDHEYKIIRINDGAERWVYGTGQLEFDEKGNPIRMHGAIQDITERKFAEILLQNKTEEIEVQNEELIQTNQELLKAKEKTEESEKKLKEAQRIAHLGNWELNVETNELIWSDEIYRIFDCEPQEFKATYEAFLEFIHPDDRKKVNSAYLKSLETKTEYQIEHRIITKNNQLKYVKEKCTSTFNDQGKPLNSFGVVIDITEEKELANELQQSQTLLTEAEILTDMGSWEWDVNKDIVFWSEGLFRVFKRSPKEGAPNWEQQAAFYVKEDFEALSKVVAECIKNGTPYQFELRAICSDGEIKHCIARGNVDRDADQKNVRLWGTLQDLTEIRRKESALRESETQYRNLANSGLALVWTSGTDKLHNYFNEPWLKFTGKTLEQEMGNGWTEGVHPDDFDRCLATYDNAFDKQEAFELEYRLRHVSGDYRWILDMGTPNINSNKEFVGFIGNCFDINERKIIEDTQAFLLHISNPDSDDNFFDSLAIHLSKSLDMEYVCIDILDGDELTAQTLAIYNEGNFDPNVSYALKDTPCGEVVDNHICCYPSEVRSLFPNDPALNDIKAESYIGTTLRNSHGKAIGLIAVIGQKPLLNNKLATTVLKLVSLRAAGKLEATLAEKKLLENEERFRNFFENSVVGKSITSIDGKLSVNNAFCNIVGYSEAELNKLNWKEITHADDIELDITIVNSILSGEKQSDHWEKRYIHKDGHIIWTDISTTLQRDGNGNPLYFITAIIDITERKKAELALSESEEEYRNLIELSPLAMAIIHDWRTIYLNPAAVQLFGANSESELVNRPILDFIHPDCHELASENSKLLVERGVVPIQVQKYLKTDGSVLDVETQAKTIQFNGERATLVVINDITERKRAEEELARNTQLLEESQSIAKLGGWELDVLTGILYWSAETYRIHDTSPQEFNPTVEAGVSYFLPVSKQIITEALERAINQGIGYDLQLETYTTKGRKIDVKTTCRCTIENGKTIKLTGIFQDITQQKLDEKNLKDSQKLLSETEKIGNVGGWEYYYNSGILNWTKQTYNIHELQYDKNVSLDAGINFYTPEAIPIINNAVQQAIELSIPFDLELDIITVKGNIRTVHTIGKCDPENHRIYGFFQDITERKKAEEQMSMQLQELRRWYDVTLDREGRVLELKHEVNELLKELGKALRYESATGDNTDTSNNV